MTKEQQIQELANTIAKACPDLLENNCDGVPCVSCLAKKLYRTGYRKQEENSKQAVKEFWEKAQRYVKALNNLLDEEGHYILEDTLEHIDELTTEFI